MHGKELTHAWIQFVRMHSIYHICYVCGILPTGLTVSDQGMEEETAPQLPSAVDKLVADMAQFEVYIIGKSRHQAPAPDRNTLQTASGWYSVLACGACRRRACQLQGRPLAGAAAQAAVHLLCQPQVHTVRCCLLRPLGGW